MEELVRPHGFLWHLVAFSSQDALEDSSLTAASPRRPKTRPIIQEKEVKERPEVSSRPRLRKVLVILM